MKTHYTKTLIGVFAIILAVSVFLTSQAFAGTTKGISIKLTSANLAPFSIFTIKGSGFDVNAATSAIFTLADGKTLTVPALSVSKSKIEIFVPLAAGKVSMKIIQVKDSSGKLLVNTSNEVAKISIKAPAVVNNRLPKGAITASFIAASLDALASTYRALPPSETQLLASVSLAQDSQRELLDKLEILIEDPTASIELNTNTGTVTLKAEDFTELDAFYAGFLGQVKKRHLALKSFENLFAFIPVAEATEMNGCMQQALGEGVGDTQLQKILEEPCRYRESVATQAQKAGKVLPEAAKFAYSLPLMLGSIQLAALTESAALSTAAQVGISAGYSFITEALIEGKIAASNAVESITKAFVDNRLGIPLLELAIPSAKLFNAVCEAMPELNIKAPKEPSQAVLPVPGSSPPKVQFIRYTSGSAKVSKFPVPPAKQSTAIDDEDSSSTPPNPPPEPYTPPVIPMDTGNDVVEPVAPPLPPAPPPPPPPVVPQCGTEPVYDCSKCNGLPSGYISGGNPNNFKYEDCLTACQNEFYSASGTYNQCMGW